MSFLRQIWSVTAMNLAGLPSRAGASLVTVIGVACVVAVMLSLLGVGAGVRHAAKGADRPDQAIVLTSGAIITMGSFSPGDVAQIAEAPGIKRDAAGKPMVQPQAAVIVELQSKTGGGTNNASFVGSGEIGHEMQGASFHLTKGRMYRPGLHELIVGDAAQRQYKNLDVGDTVVLRGTPWTVVGAFKDDGGLDENSLVSDADTVLAAFARPAYQSVTVELASPADFQQFKDALTSNPQLQVKVQRLADYAAEQLKPLTGLLSFIGYFVGGVMALGVIFGALNTMYSAVDGRRREIATLRALGFNGAAVAVSVMVESFALAIPGALIGAALAWLLFSGHDIAMAGLSFAMQVTPGLILLGLIWAAVIGLIGGLAPAIRAVTLPVADALRTT
ncbi:MAG TPA: ABC transporter permease [Caulobacteraceae bacterium]|jgi:putative ABC transport system permease protein